VALDQDEVEVLEVVVAAHGNQAIEEIREAAEEEIVEEVGPADLAVGEVVELEEEEDLEEVDGESGVEHIGVDEADIEQQREQGGHVGEDLVEGADDDQVAQDVHAELEVAQMVEVDGSADSPLSDTIDLTDSPAPSQRSLDPLQCPVCLDLLRGLPDWKEVVSTPCGHLFCNTCLATALRRVWYCPACRKRTKPGDAIKIFL